MQIGNIIEVQLNRKRRKHCLPLDVSQGGKCRKLASYCIPPRLHYNSRDMRIKNVVVPKIYVGLCNRNTFSRVQVETVHKYTLEDMSCE